MKLTNEQIRCITTGTVYIEETEKGLAFHRFSKEQEEFFAGGNKYFQDDFFTKEFGGCYFGFMAKSTAGVTFDFYTDAKNLFVEIGELILPANAEVQNFDIYVNGKHKLTCAANENIELTLQKGQKRVTVYFPWGNYPIVKGVDLDGSTYCTAVGGETDVLCIGDSITHGGNSNHPAITWVTVMARKLGVRVINQGLCGFVNDAGCVAKVCDPKVVITAYGVNDYGRKTHLQMEEDTDAFIKKVKECYPNAKVCSILPIWTAFNTDPGNWFEDKRAILKSVYEKNGVHIIDGMKMVPHDTKYMADGVVHPNEAGFVYYGGRVAKIVNEYIKK